MRRVGVLLGFSENNLEHRAFVTAFVEEMARLGWVDGRNMRMEQRWTNADKTRAQAFAAELVASQPDVILCSSTPVTAVLHQATSTVPVVFTTVSDPVGAGFVAGLPHPGGNMTGFIHTDAALGGKWVSLLKEIAPALKRVAIMFNPDTAPGRGNLFLGSFEAGARALAVEAATLPVRSDSDIETAIAALGGDRTGVVLMDDSFMAVHYPAVLTAAARNGVPAISVVAQFVRDGGLISYDTNVTDQFRGAAGYVDRILRGAKPADLPVQTPTKFIISINLKTAKALGLTVPSELLATADEVIE